MKSIRIHISRNAPNSVDFQSSDFTYAAGYYLLDPKDPADKRILDRMDLAFCVQDISVVESTLGKSVSHSDGAILFQSCMPPEQFQEIVENRQGLREGMMLRGRSGGSHWNAVLHVEATYPVPESHWRVVTDSGAVMSGLTSEDVHGNWYVEQPPGTNPLASSGPQQCPFCGGEEVRDVNGIIVAVVDDPNDPEAGASGHKMDLDEWQCHGKCGGRSFWV